MPRTGRAAPGGRVYHVLNRGNGRCRLFHKDADYEAFESLLAEVRQAVPVELLAWCLMPNHWHLVLRPAEDGQLSRFMLRLSTAHVRRHFAYYHTSSGGHLYQGRFKCFPVQDDGHYLTVCRYVEANPLRGGLVERARDWQWSSLWVYLHKTATLRPDPWPVRRPAGWEALVQAAMDKSDLEQLRTCVKRGRPFGSEQWVLKTARQLGLDFTMRNRGRPKKSGK